MDFFVSFLVLMLALGLCLALCLLCQVFCCSEGTALPSSQKTRRTSGVSCGETGRRRSFETSLKEVEGGEEIEDPER